VKFQEQAIKMIQEANKDFFRSAHSMPQDKLSWKVTDQGRSALEILQEVAQSPEWFAPMLNPGFKFEMDPEAMEQGAKERAQWTTVDECERACNERCEALFEKIRTHPDNDMERTISLPFGEGMTLSMADVMMGQYWNCTYHTGQINFIQTLYGDHEMH